MRRAIIRVGLLGLCCALAGAAGRDEPAAQPVDPTAADLEALQGTWRREYRTPQGTTLRSEKTIAGQRDMVTEFDPNNNVIHSHTAKIMLKPVGGVRIYTFSEYVATVGPAAGQPWVGPSSFVYRIDGDRMYEAWGLVDGDPSVPSIVEWKRVKQP